MILRVMAWNIYWGLGAPNARNHQSYYAKLYKVKHSEKVLRAMEKTLKKIHPDILALQEADGRYHLPAFKKLLPYAKFSVERNGRGWSNGNALLLRGKAILAEIRLPYFVEKRNYVRADIMLGAKQLTIITTHLGSQSTNEERMEQLKTLAKIINSIDHPVIVLGDVNCEPSSPEFNYFLKNTKLQPLFTEPTYPVYKPEKNYDNIFISKEFRVAKADVLNVKLSDHLPIYADLEI